MTKFNQFTFWNENDTKEHVTLRICNDGTILHLSRDETKSVVPEWHAIGTHGVGRSGNRYMVFTVSVPHLWVAATQLARNAEVFGSSLKYETQLTYMPTDKVTDPDTLLGRKRRRSLDLHMVGAGEQGSCHFRVGKFGTDVELMRLTIEANRKRAK